MEAVRNIKLAVQKKLSAKNLIDVGDVVSISNFDSRTILSSLVVKSITKNGPCTFIELESGRDISDAIFRYNIRVGSPCIILKNVRIKGKNDKEKLTATLMGICIMEENDLVRVVLGEINA